MTPGLLEEKKEQGREQAWRGETNRQNGSLFLYIYKWENPPEKQLRLRWQTASIHTVWRWWQAPHRAIKLIRMYNPCVLYYKKESVTVYWHGRENGLYKSVTLCSFWIEFQGLLSQSKMHLNQQAGKTAFTSARLFLRWFPCPVKTPDDKRAAKQPGIRTGDHYLPLKRVFAV